MPYKLAANFLTVAILFAFTHSATAQHPTLKLRPKGISDRGLVNAGTARKTVTNRLQVFSELESTPDTLRVLAIRVDFAEDNSGLTTGNGQFDFSVSADVTIDPAPHDRTYFQHQLLALSNYYKTASNNKLVLQGEVYPENMNGTYTLSREMSYYSPAQSEELLDQMGIWVTRLNANLVLGALGLDLQVPNTIQEAAETSLARKIIVMGGTTPGHTTDAVAAELAKQVQASRIINATVVDGVYSVDPRMDPEAEKYATMSPDELLALTGDKHELAGPNIVFDPKGALLVKELGIPLFVCRGDDWHAMELAVRGVEEGFAGTVVKSV